MKRKKEHILLVNDEMVVQDLLESYLRKNDYRVTCCRNSTEALKKLSKVKIDLILLDIGRLEMDGYGLFDNLKSNLQTKDIPVIFITEGKDTANVTKGLTLGATDYIGKPINEIKLLARIKHHLKLKELQQNQKNLVKQGTAELEKEITQREETEKALEQSNLKLQKLTKDTLNLLASVVEIRDPFTAGHQQNVTYLSVLIAQDMGLPEEVIEAVRIAATVHDIGKIRIPIEILSKSRKLLDIEMEIIKTHPLTGYELLKDIDFPWPIAEIVLQHHERLDGSGYPDGLKGDKIRLEAKILGVADVIEGIAYHRPYRAGLGLENAIEEIRKNRGILYDPEIVDIAIRILKNKDFRFIK
jgi:putative two-component system response regulator